MMTFSVICIVVALLSKYSHAYCRRHYLSAREGAQTFVQGRYENNEFCRIFIGPSAGLRSNQYFLEIRWIHFDIKGNMPACKEDYVEVFLTRSETSIGTFCSNNTIEEMPFSMYSKDGYAVLVFSSDEQNQGTGFSFSYRLRNKTLEPLTGNSRCNYVGAHSVVYFSSGWPNERMTSHYCWLRQKLSDGENLRLSIMDVHFEKSINMSWNVNCSTYGYFQLLESESQHSVLNRIESSSAVSGKICNVQDGKPYVARKKYVYLTFKSYANYRYQGFLVGYVIYKPLPKSKEATLEAWQAVLLAFGSCIFVLLFFFWKSIKKKILMKIHREEATSQRDSAPEHGQQQAASTNAGSAFVIHNYSRNTVSLMPYPTANGSSVPVEGIVVQPPSYYSHQPYTPACEPPPEYEPPPAYEH